MTAPPDAPARRSGRRLIRVALVAGLVLLLSGCLKYDLRLLVNENDTMDGVLIVAIAREFAVNTDVFGQSEVLNPSSGSITREAYEDEEYIGTKYTLTGVPISDLNVLSTDGSTDYSLTRQGEEFILNARLAFNIGSQDVPAVTNFSALIVFTFPGVVLESNGAIDGNTVTWGDLRADATNELNARASAVANGAAGDTGGGLPWWAWLAGGVILLAAIGAAFALLLRRRRSTAAASIASPPPWTGERVPGYAASVDQYGSPASPNASGYPYGDPANASYPSTPYDGSAYEGATYDSSLYDASSYDSNYDYLYGPQTDVTPVQVPGQYSGQTVLSHPAGVPPPGQEQRPPG